MRSLSNDVVFLGDCDDGFFSNRAILFGGGDESLLNSFNLAGEAIFLLTMKDLEVSMSRNIKLLKSIVTATQKCIYFFEIQNQIW